MRLAKLFWLFLGLATVPSSAASIYEISIDTSSLAPGTSGFIDFTFNGGYPATAVVDGFSNAGGSLDSTAVFTQGTVSGRLPGVVTMRDDNADYGEGISFGSSTGFRLTLSGIPSGSTGDTFTLSFFNSSITGGLLTGNVNDFWIAQFQLDTKGTVTSTAFANPSGGLSFATITAVPEPPTELLLTVGLFVAFFLCRRNPQLQVKRFEPPVRPLV